MRVASLVTLTVLLAASRVQAAPDLPLSDPNFLELLWVSSPDLGEATAMAWAPDGSNRLFVTRQNGEVRVIKDGVLLPAPFATITPLVAMGEMGLLGIVFDPDFAVNHHVYLFATVSTSEQQIIRLTALGDTGTDKTVVVPGLSTRGGNHNGGALGIGPDGKLYWGLGDHAMGVGVNDDRTLLAAKIGRANLDGSAPADNPFFDGPGPNADHIWARGFRNPYSLTFQPATGLLWVNVVGTVYEQIFIVHRGDHAGYNLYENNQPAGFITPVVKYASNTLDIRSIMPPAMTGAVRAAGTLTITTDVPHGYRPGDQITVAGVQDPSFDGTVFVATVPTPTTFTARHTGVDAASGGGTVSTVPIGGCVTGGAFYDATAFPAAFRGNFFFGDYNSSRVIRVSLDPTTNVPTRVEPFAGVSAAVDVAVGPDGSLYYVGHRSNAVYRVHYKYSAQGIIVSPTNVWMAEGQPAVVTLSLAMPPAPGTTVSVNVARSTGDGDVTVTSPATVEFDASNYATPSAGHHRRRARPGQRRRPGHHLLQRERAGHPDHHHPRPRRERPGAEGHPGGPGPARGGQRHLHRGPVRAAIAGREGGGHPEWRSGPHRHSRRGRPVHPD
jgi:glucose/arabinose dehydrogenase